MTAAEIRGKKILFFSPAFFRYEDVIADKMREMGAQVDWYDVRSVAGSFQRALVKVSPLFFINRSRKYYERVIEENKGKQYDYLLIVKGDMTPVNILKRFRAAYPHAKLCLYLWDSVENIPGIQRKFRYFDTLHSFDPADCKKYPRLQFRPLFFADQFRRDNYADTGCKYDVSFLGTVHSDRYAVIKQAQRLAREQSLSCFWFLYLQSKFIFLFYKLTKKEFRGVSQSAFSFDRMAAPDIAKIVNESKAILDIQHPRQSGLTMRTIEMIGMKKKLITTNPSVKDYDFYRFGGIAVIDRKNVALPHDFLSRDCPPLPKDVYEKYSLTSWILDVLS